MRKRRSRRNRSTNFKRKNYRLLNVMNNIEGRKNERNYRGASRPKFPNNLHNGHITSNWFWSNYRIAHNFWKIKEPADDWTGLLRDHPEVEGLIEKYLPNTYCFVSGNWKNNPYGNQSKYNQTWEHSDSSIGVDTQTKKTNNDAYNNYDDDGEVEVEEEDASDEVEFEMSEEMIEFFKVSFRHKMNLKKEKEDKEQALDLETKVKEFQANKLKRVSEMEFLYGEEASKIIGMETALQLSFDKYCDTKVPQYWPNIPLNL